MRVRLNILRSDPDSGKKPEYQTFTIDVEPDQTVAGVLQYIYENVDPSLAFRFVCNCQKCAECAVMVNGSPCLACEKTVEPEMTIEPLANLPVIKDLVVDRRQALNKPLELLPFLKTPPVMDQSELETVGPSKTDSYYKVTECIQCLICQSVCPALKNEPERFAGPLGLVWLAQSSIIAADHQEEKARQALKLCLFCGNCWKACPRGATIPSEFFREVVIAPCRYACPAGIDVPRYIRFIKEGKFDEAVNVIREKIPFPAVCGHVCTHPCEAKCRRAQLDDSVAIKALKRFVADNHDRDWKPEKAAATGKRMAIVGSGPAGLTAAYYLAKLGHSVTVFEALSEAGGMMRVGMPKYRLPREILDREINCIKELGVEIKLNSKVESPDNLLQQGYDAVFLAIGAHLGAKIGIKGEDLPGVIDGVAFQRHVNLGKEVKLGKRVVVLGGGNVAIDCARTALRLGASDVHVACLEPADYMLATSEEIAWAQEEGITIHNSNTFNRIVSDDGQVNGVVCLDVRSFEFDDNGKLHVEPVPGSEHIIAADTIIIAIGQRSELDLIEGITGINVTRRGTVDVDPVMLTVGKEGVFAGGDVVTGPASVIEAIATGRRAAISIDKYLGGNGEINEHLASSQDDTSSPGETEFSPLAEREKKPRQPIPTIPPAKRLSGFTEVEVGFSDEQATAEARRCLMCDIELQELSKE